MLRVAMAAVVGAIMLAVLEAVTYAAILPDFVEANRISYEGLFKEQPDFVPYFLFNLVWASLLAYVFEHWANIRSFNRGAAAGAIFLGAVVLGINFGYAAFFNFLRNFFVVVPVKVAAAAITGALVGGVMATILGWGDRRGSTRERESLAQREEAI